MRYNDKSPRCRSKIIPSIIAIIGVVSLPFISGQIRMNFTPSIPTGLYYTVGQSDVIGFCLRPDIATYAMSRGYIDTGDCADGSRRLLKRIVARAGDFVEVSDDGVFINGKFLGDHTKPRLTDSHGREMPRFRFAGEIPYGYVFVLGDAPNSFDSRYYGAIALSDNDVYVRPLLMI